MKIFIGQLVGTLKLIESPLPDRGVKLPHPSHSKWSIEPLKDVWYPFSNDDIPVQYDNSVVHPQERLKVIKPVKGWVNFAYRPTQEDEIRADRRRVSLLRIDAEVLVLPPSVGITIEAEYSGLHILVFFLTNAPRAHPDNSVGRPTNAPPRVESIGI